MKILEYPLRKTFEKPFINSEFKTLFILVFEQATIEEYHEFIALDTKEQYEMIIKMIIDQIPRTKVQETLGKYGVYFGIEKQIRNGLIEDWVEEFIKEVIACKFRIYKSVFEEVSKQEPVDETEMVMYSISMANVCKTFNINGPEEVMKKYTLEQYYWMVDAVQYMANTGTPEGVAKNKMALQDKEKIVSKAEDVRSKIESFKKETK